MAELKKCPFCGGEAKYMDITEGIFISRFVTCTKCGIETKRNYLRRNEAIEAWNNRATESEIRAKAIDEFAERVKQRYFFDCNKRDIDIIAEQLKERE